MLICKHVESWFLHCGLNRLRMDNTMTDKAAWEPARLDGAFVLVPLRHSRHLHLHGGDVQPPAAVAELLRRNSRFLQQGQVQICQRRTLWISQVTSPLDMGRPSAR